MTPLKVWSIISKNLLTLYQVRATMSNLPAVKGYSAEEIEVEVIAYKALQEMAERTNNKDL